MLSMIVTVAVAGYDAVLTPPMGIIHAALVAAVGVCFRMVHKLLAQYRTLTS